MFEKSAVTIALFCLLCVPPVFAKSIKCVDSKGITHYGDTIPPECADKAVTEIDDKGLPLKENPANMTPEERRAMEAEVQKQAEVAQKEKDQRRHDSALLSTYASVAEIDMARDRNVQQISLSLTNIETRLKSAQDKLAQLNAQADGFTRTSKPLPPDLDQNIKSSKNEISDLEVERVQKQQDLSTMKAKYDADRKRYMELTRPEKP